MSQKNGTFQVSLSATFWILSLQYSAFIRQIRVIRALARLGSKSGEFREMTRSL